MVTWAPRVERLQVELSRLSDIGTSAIGGFGKLSDVGTSAIGGSPMAIRSLLLCR